MNANVNKNNTGKLLVAVLAMAMIFAGAAVLFSDDADAAETTYIHGGITAGTTDKVNNQEYTAGSVVVVDGDLTIPKYAKLTINGATFTVNSGYTVTIEVGGQLEIKGDAKVNINGTIETEGNCTETFKDSNNQYVAPIVINNTNTQNDDKVGVFVSGSLVLNNGSTLTAGTGEGKPAGTINVKNSATVEFNDGSQIIGQTFVLDNGASILYNGSTDKTGFTIKMNTSNGVYATTEVKITGAETPDEDADYSDLTFTASSKNISGYTWSVDKAVPKTIKQYTVAISGTVDNTETVTISSTISDSETYYTSAEYAEAYAKASTTPYKMWDSVVMGKVAIDNLNVENKASFVNDNAWMVVNGKITVADKSDDTTSDQGIVKNSGIVEVVGSIVISKDSFGGKATNTHGTIAINGGTVDFKDGAPGDSFLYGAMYTDDDDVLHISSLEAALNGAVADGVKKVSVYSTYGSGDENVKVGSYMLTSDLTIPAGIELTIYNGFIVDEGVTLTFSADNKIKFGADGNATQGYLFVDGKVIDNSRKLESAEQTNMLFEVKIVTGEGRETVNTYTTLKNALSETTSGTIYLYNDVKVEGTLTIPENVTVQYSEDANSEASVIMMDKSILNVNGVLFLDGKHGLKADVDAEEYTVNSYNIIKAAEQTAGSETIKVDIAGAWFVAALGDDEDTYQYITSIAVAAENSASLVDYPIITIMGTVSMGTVTFTAPEDTILIINIDNDADMGGNQKATGDVTLVGKTIFDMTEGMYDGTITSTVSAGTSTIDFDNSLDAIVTINSEETVDGVDTTMILSTEGEADGTITVSAGSVSITSEIWISKLVIGSGATVVIADGGDLTTGVNQGFKANTILKELPVLTDELVGNLAGLVVDGTLTVEDGAILTANLSVINGTVSIADGSDVDMLFAFVNGTLDIEDGASAGYLILFVNGTINGSVEPITQTVGGKPMTLGVVIAFPGSDVSAAKIYYGGSNESMADITTFYVNGAEWATVYATQDNVDVLAMLMAIDIDGVDETTAVFYSDAGMTQVIVNKDKVTALVNGVKGLTIDKGTTAFIESLFNLGRDKTIFGTGYTVGTFENVYIDMAASNVNGTITVYQGMDLYIDGKSITNFAQADDSGKVTYTLPVGQHTFSVQIDPGLTGTYEITLDGQTITGDTFTIADNAKDFQIVVTGSLSQESVVVDGGNSDSGMGLTDYLLIILVVLIVIMAIMVAMRLMRS